MEQSILEELKKILWYIEEYNKGNEEYIQEMIDISYGIKKYTKTNYKNYVKFSLLNIYLNLEIYILNKDFYENPEYQSVMQYCKDDIKYYLEVSRMLQGYVNECLKTDNYEHLDTAYLLTIKISNILTSISNYFAYIRQIQKYNNTGIVYQFPNNIREEGELNIKEIEESLKILGLRSED